MTAHSIDVLSRNEPTRSGAIRYVALGVCLDCDWQGHLADNYSDAFKQAADHRFRPSRPHETVTLTTTEDGQLTRAIAVCLTCPWRGKPVTDLNEATKRALQHEDAA